MSEKSLIEKMFFKPEYSALFENIPADLQEEFSKKEGSAPYNFILIFVTTKNELEKQAKRLKEKLADGGLLWVAYPKAKAKNTDLNRDIIRVSLKNYGLEAVSIVAINDLWSALRLKKL